MDERRLNYNFPNRMDFQGASMALIRLQTTYQLQVEQFSSGILNGIKYG